MLLYLRYLSSAFLLVAVAPLYLVAWIFLQLSMKVCKASNLAIRIDQIMYASYQRFIIFFFEVVAGTKLVLYGDFKDVLTKRENIILFGNHQCLVDWVVVSMLAERSGTPGFVRFVLKQSLKFIPLYGYYFKQHGYLYVERGGNFKKVKFEEQLDQLAEHPFPIWLTLFPEGHRYNPEDKQSILKMRHYAKKNDLLIYDHVLTPRTKAFTICLEKLSGRLDAIYDMTFAFSSTLPEFQDVGTPIRYGPPSYLDLFKKELVIHLHVSRIPISQVPTKAEDFEGWLYTRYSIKDKLLADFYSKDISTRGTFGPWGTPSGLNLVTVFITACIYFVCLMPWLLSWYSFKLYLLISCILGVATVLISSFCY